MGSITIAEDHKCRLRDSYQKLDPVLVLQGIEHLQDKFWQYAHMKTAAPAADSPAITESISKASDQQKQILMLLSATAASSVQDNGIRMYRRTRKPSGPRTWRTRQDPFADV